jgi:hypothetical protein
VWASGRTSGVRSQRCHTCGGRFFGPWVNCEQVPPLAAWAVAKIFDDPQETPRLFVWKDSGGTVQESVHITPHNSDVQIATNGLRICGERDVETGEAEIQRYDGTTDIIRTLLRPLPRNGESVQLLICPDCLTPRRGLYGWEPNEDGGSPPASRGQIGGVEPATNCATHPRAARLWFVDVELSRGWLGAVLARGLGIRAFSHRAKRRRKRASEQSREARHTSGCAWPRAW